MKIMNFKTFEAKLIKELPPILATSEEDLTNYYRCNRCGKDFYVINDAPELCNTCHSNDIVQITDFDYFTDLKKGDTETYKKELSSKRKRGENMVDLVNFGLRKEKQRYKKSLN